MIQELIDNGFIKRYKPKELEEFPNYLNYAFCKQVEGLTVDIVPVLLINDLSNEDFDYNMVTEWDCHIDDPTCISLGSLIVTSYAELEEFINLVVKNYRDRVKGLPKVGQIYKFYDKGKVNYTRQFDAKVIRIISKEQSTSITFPLYVGYNGEYTTYIDNDNPVKEASKSLYDVWKDEQYEWDNIYLKNNDYFVECSIPEYDDNTIWFVRGADDSWCSLNIQSDWQYGCLDVDNKLTEILKEQDKIIKNETNSN